MSRSFDTVEEAFFLLADPQHPDWGAAFAFLAMHPDMADDMRETLCDTLEQMGVEPNGTDAKTGLPTFSAEDVARAIGVPAAELERGADS